ncbi:MAG: hypothetical protein DI607_12515 [Sphingomonas hengshuiensis]|nr:MAG: hypothetical protein DI607_12515 [Sphingomonas hengshuiensis]
MADRHPPTSFPPTCAAGQEGDSFSNKSIAAHASTEVDGASLLDSYVDDRGRGGAVGSTLTVSSLSSLARRNASLALAKLLARDLARFDHRGTPAAEPEQQ